MKCEYLNDSGNCTTIDDKQKCLKSRLKCIVSPTCWRIKPFKQMNKSECQGCEDDFYNGKNPYNVKECWGLKTAKIILRKKVSVSQSPPWKQKAQKYPSCYKVKGYVFVGADRER